MTIDRWIIDAANQHPDKVALEFGAEKIGYAQFAHRVDACVTSFKQANIQHGDRIAWYGLNHPDVFVLLFACARLGAIFVPLNWRLAAPEVAAIVANCEPALLYYDQHFAEQAIALPDVKTFAHRDKLSVSTTPCATFNHGADHSEYNTRPASASNTTESDPVLLVYTSGSTGQPKGALLSHKSIICNAAMSIEAHNMRENDVALVMLPLFHVGGLNILPTPAFSIGATVILHDRFDPDQACIDLPRATLAITVPTVLQAMMASEYWRNVDFSSVRGLSIGSTDVPVSLIDTMHELGIPMPQIYGATETGPFAIYQTLDNAMSSIGSIGRAGSRCKIRLVMNGKDVSVGEPGEIWVKGDNVLTEYWQDDKLSAQMLQDGWLRTGDVAICDKNGFYWFKDRMKHVIISGGENIYPTEIERALSQLPSISEVSVVGKADAKWGEIPVAVVVTDGNIDKADVLSSLHGKLARYKHPKEVVFVDALPRNAMGKVVAADVRKLTD